MTITPLITFIRLFGFAIIFSLAMPTHADETSAVKADTSNQYKNIHIRTLAASCAACHGTQGNSHSITPVLAGLDTTYFSTQMLAFKNRSQSSTVMHHHAQGLTDDEINQLSYYFSQQKRISTPSPTPQTLKANHE